MQFDELSVYNRCKIKKGERMFTFFCPKSTMNLTYLCYGESNLEDIWIKHINF